MGGSVLSAFASLPFTGSTEVSQGLVQVCIFIYRIRRDPPTLVSRISITSRWRFFSQSFGPKSSFNCLGFLFVCCLFVFSFTYLHYHHQEKLTEVCLALDQIFKKNKREKLRNSSPSHVVFPGWTFLYHPWLLLFRYHSWLLSVFWKEFLDVISTRDGLYSMLTTSLLIQANTSNLKT